MAESAPKPADCTSAASTMASTPSPRLEPAQMPPARSPAVAAVSTGDQAQAANTSESAVGAQPPSTSPSVGQPRPAPPPEAGPSEAAEAGTSESAEAVASENAGGEQVQQLQQLLLQQRLQQLQQQTAILQLQQVLCAQALNSAGPPPPGQAPPPPPAADSSQLLQQLAMLTPAQQMALLQLGGAGGALSALSPSLLPGPMSGAADSAGQQSSARRAPRSSEAGNSGENQGTVRRKFHGKAAVAYLQEWLYANIKNPYPSLELKRMLARTSGLTEAQVDHWFNNARKRIVKGRKLKKESQHPAASNSPPPPPPSDSAAGLASPMGIKETGAVLALQNLAGAGCGSDAPMGIKEAGADSAPQNLAGAGAGAGPGQVN